MTNLNIYDILLLILTFSFVCSQDDLEDFVAERSREAIKNKKNAPEDMRTIDEIAEVSCSLVVFDSEDEKKESKNPKPD